MSKTIAILTSGGDSPGMNAAIRAATMVAVAKGHRVMGVRHGYRGLLDGKLSLVSAEEVSDILREGGTFLHSARCRQFLETGARDQAREVLTQHGVDGLIVIGGNGSLTGLALLSDPDEAKGWPVQCIGIPASIDNDIALTGLAIGVDTAMNTIVEACDRIMDTASAHDRTFIIEVMGRDCGYLAMTSAIASGANMVLFPEASRTEEELVSSMVKTILTVRERHRENQKVVAIKAEGVPTPTDRLKTLVDAKLSEVTGQDHDDIETRVTVLGHVVRGGRPTAFDRLLGSRFGNVAVRAILAGEHRKMVAWLPPMDLPAGVGTRSPADPYCYLIDLPAVLAATKELLEGQSPLARWRATAFDDLEDVFLL
ncbi:MAG: ATP-dependent 6-phosphofructokinase [Myxococcales bacterium]|nr:ATP-dependent 6-phosphofructokinase [Myxococcales bacterium]